jgi:hypothetical protein
VSSAVMRTKVKAMSYGLPTTRTQRIRAEQTTSSRILKRSS